jgi:hypothetical protein
MNCLWVLGASDPEMEAIERLLAQAGQKVAYATVAGERASPDSAYQADGTTSGHPEEPVLFVECSVRGIKPWLVVDHHRPGDPGYRVPPEEFLPGSSIGQVISVLAYHDSLPLDGADAAWASPYPVSPSLFPAGTIRYSPTGGWLVSARPSRYNPVSWHRVSQEVLFVAAADHCLAAAYQGRCPGVDPDELMRWRAETRARYQGRPVQAVLEDIARAREALAQAPRVLIGGVPVADLRGQEIPELPEAAAREGIPFLATPRARPGTRRKVVLQCAPPEVLAAWPEWAARNGITGLYGGDPERGFAGGYLA